MLLGDIASRVTIAQFMIAQGYRTGRSGGAAGVRVAVALSIGLASVTTTGNEEGCGAVFLAANALRF